MTKPKRAICVGDKVKFRYISDSHGALEVIATEEVLKIDDKIISVRHHYYPSGRAILRCQVISVIRKKKKREPRVVFETVWSGNNSRCLHFSEVSAKNFMERERPGVQYKLVKFREVL